MPLKLITKFFFLKDVDGIKYVINFDYPQSSEDYIHRIGRTGRSNTKGTSFAFFTKNNAKQSRALIDVLREANQEINPELENMARNSRMDGSGGRSRYGGGGSRFGGTFKRGTMGGGGAGMGMGGGRGYGGENRGYSKPSYGGGNAASAGGAGNGRSNGYGGGSSSNNGGRHTRFD